jgi:hypothetical protein
MRGDRIYTSLPVPGGSEGWVCIQSGGFQAATPADTDWKSPHAYRVGDFIVPLANNSGNMTYQVTSFVPSCLTLYGTSGANEPNWHNAAPNTGNQVTDNDLVWTCVGPMNPLFKEFGTIAA